MKDFKAKEFGLIYKEFYVKESICGFGNFQEKTFSELNFNNF